MGKSIFYKYWFIFKLLINIVKKIPNFIVLGVWNFCLSRQGMLYVLLRYLLFSSWVKTYDKNSYIGTNVVLKNIHNLEVGENFSLHDFCYIDAIGGIKIGHNVSIAHNCSLVSFNHTWNNAELPIKYNPLKEEPIIIEDDVWVGCGVRIMAGVVLGKRSIIAAGSVVVKDVPPNSLVGGVPARVLKQI